LLARSWITSTDNGLLLRSDVHTLYDRGYLGIDSKHRLFVSPRVRIEFGLGGVSRQRVYRLTRRAAVPEPIAKLAQGSIWLAEDVDRWIASRGTQAAQRPGVEQC
jgi:predicted DNA-binding transcriptional regulator AlpA